MNNPVSEKSGEAPPSSSGSPQPKLEDRGHAAGAASPREALLNALSEEKKSPSPPPPLMSQPLLSGDAKPVILGGSAVDALRSRTVGGGTNTMPPRPPHANASSLLPPRPPPIQSRQTTLNSHQGTKISIRDIVGHSPLESEADTYIQSTLDEVDPTRGIGFTGLPQTTILGHVPLDAARDAFEEIKSPDTGLGSGSVGGGGGAAVAASGSVTQASGGGTPALPLYKRAQHSREGKTSTAEDLWQLTIDMQRLERPGMLRAATSGAAVQHKSHRHLGVSGGSVDGGGGGDGDRVSNTLAENAVRIMKRNASLAVRHGGGVMADGGENIASPTASDVAEAAELTATDRWKRLKNAVQATSSFDGDAKKSDEATPDVEEGEGGGEEDELMEVCSDGEKVESGTVSERFGTSLNAASLRKKRGKTTYKDFEDWVRFKSMSFKTYAKLVLAIMVVATGVAAILFYLVGNPPCNTQPCIVMTNRTDFQLNIEYFSRASASWWLLFLLCRQVVTMSLGRVTMNLIIDYFALRSKLCVRMFGPFVTLFIVQSKGWPFLLFMWCVYDFVLLFGNGKFAQHWLFYQDAIGLFNEENPSGGVTSSQEYQTVLIVAIVVSFVVAVKRFWLGLVQGKRTYRRYGEDLAKVMKKALYVGQVASLARDIEDSDLRIDDFTVHVSNEFLEDSMVDKTEPTSPRSPSDRQEEFRRNLISGVDTSTRKAVLDELLGAWEEPDAQREQEEHVNIASIIQFRQSVTYLNEAFPFGVAFGPASTRQECVESAETVYNRLMLCIPSKLCLTFDVLALLAVRRQGNLDEEKLKALIKIFRPDREGNLTLLDFAKSVDSVYKELRLLRASVANASKLDKAFESIVNIFFYVILACIVLAALGINPLVLFASISGFVLGFAFMIGAACSKYFEGLLMIFIRRPYDIGDRIALSNPFQDTLSTGSQSWVVKDIDLYTTTVVLGATNEVSTISNGSLAGLRIINCARSPKASLSTLLKFPIDVSYTKLQVFKSAVEKFIKARPREWISFTAFRATRVEADLGFVEYLVSAQHRESWQNLGALLESKAQLSSFGLELSKKMDMRYVSPPMPIDLNLQQKDARILNVPVPDVIERMPESENLNEFDVADSVAAMFGTKLSPTKMD